MADWWTVPREWEGETCVCIATGPSLTPEQVDACRGRAKVIAISDAYRLAPWADVLYSCDSKWWNYHWGIGAGKFAGLKVGLDDSIPFPGVKLLKYEPTAEGGYDPRPDYVRTGQNSGYQAVHIAAHFGAKRIVLIGYDMQPNGKTHYFGDHPPELVNASPYESFRRFFDLLAPDLAALGVEVINCSPGSALTAFPMGELEDVLCTQA